MTQPQHPKKSADELRELARALRHDKDTEVDDTLIKEIVDDITAYRLIFKATPNQLPVAPLDELLPLMGWVIYEASWDAVQKIPATLKSETVSEADHERGERMLRHIRLLADAARALPWPEFAARALGAIRSQALAESKRDTEEGYAAAWLAHQDARRRYGEYRESHAKGEERERFVRDLHEMLLQLNLAETGTACRTAERVISRWLEEFEGDSEDLWIERMFRELTSGVVIGESAIDTAFLIKKEYDFVKDVTELRLTMRTALQNPGIMTARAATLLLALGPEMRRRGLEPPGFANWEAWETHVLGQFEKAYRAIEDPVVVGGEPVEIRSDLRRQLIHMRLNLALLKPGYHLPSKLSFESCLQYATLDAEALEALTACLAGPVGTRGKERGIGSAMMPAFIRSVIACRSQGPGLDDTGYEEWRGRWFRFDQYSDEPTRLQNLMKATALARQV